MKADVVRGEERDIDRREGKIEEEADEEEEEEEEEEVVEAVEFHSLGLIDLYPLKAFSECLSAVLFSAIITAHL